MMEVFRATSGDPDVRKMLEDPTPDLRPRCRAGTGRPAGSAVAPRLRDRPRLAGLWAGGFVMAMYNTRIVRRSNALLDYAYGRRFRYAEYMSDGAVGARPVTSAVATATTAGTAALGSRFFRFLPRRLVEQLAPKPGTTGPSQEVRDQGWYRVETPPPPARARATYHHVPERGSRLQGDLGDAGECALALALDRDKLPELYGVLTPAAAMGDALLARFPGRASRWSPPG